MEQKINGKIENYFDEAIKNLEAAQSEQDITNALNSFDENVASIATKAEESAALDEVKANAIKELNNLVDSLKQENYTSENWALINAKLEDATKKINNATSQTSVNTLLASAKSYINNVKPIGNNNANSGEQLLNGCVGGCSGSIISTGVMLFTLFATVCFVRNKKEE